MSTAPGRFLDFISKLERTILSAAVLCAALAISTATASAQQYDLLIRGAHVRDGTGSPCHCADTAVQRRPVTCCRGHELRRYESTPLDG